MRADSTSGRRVLIADDDVEMRRWLKLVLRPLRVDAVEVGSGVELLRVLSGAGPFDLVITDVRMPAPNGLQVVAMVREAGVKTPFIVVTAFGDREVQDSAERLGVVMLSKPFDAQVFLQVARGFLESSRVA